ncbi:hypothetical protein ACQ4PT_015904 [Festuca glaucescens]
MVLGPIAFVLGSGFLWNHLKPDSTKNVPIIGDALSAAANFTKVVGKDGKDTSSSSSGDQLMSQVRGLVDLSFFALVPTAPVGQRCSILYAAKTLSDAEFYARLYSSDLNMRMIVILPSCFVGAGAYTVTAVIVAGIVGYAYIRWKGWKISDFMWVTKRGLNDACSVVGNQLNEVSDIVHVTKKHLAGRIDRVDATLDETQEIIEGTRDEVSIIHVNLSSFQKELQEVNRTVEIWGSRLCSIEDTQDRTVRATEALVGFGQQMEHGQSGSFRQISSFLPTLGSSSENIVRRVKTLPPPPALALETISSVAESEPTVEETQENRKTLSRSEGSTSDLKDGDEEREDKVENEDVAIDVAASDEEEEAEVAGVAIVADDEQPAEALNVPLDDYDVDGQAVANDADETSSATVENRPDPAIQGHEQKLDSEKIDGKNQSDDKMKKDKLLENIKKLQACVWLLEKDGADMAKIMEFRSLLESAKKQYVENEAQLAKEGSSAPLMVLNKDRLEKTHVETIAAPVEKVDRDEQSMDSGKGEVRSLNGCEEVSDENELAEEVNRLKSELETVRQDRDYQLAQAQSLMADIAKQKEVARRYELELEDAMMRVAALETGDSTIED